MSEPTLDWSTAEVKDSKLTVQVEGDLPEGWGDTFTSTAKLLGGGTWGEIKLEEQRAEVSGLKPGTEEKLKHFLESVVLQANSTHTSDEEDEEEKKDEEDGQEEDEEEQESDTDKEMSERFRSFAEDQDSNDHDKSEDEDEGEDHEGEDHEGEAESEDDDEDSEDEESGSEKSKAEKS